MIRLRKFFWRILGIDYFQILKKLDYTLLRDDQYSDKGFRTYDNGAKVWRWTSSKLKIGKYCSIANNVNFIVDEGFHSMSKITSYPFINNLTVDNNLAEIRDNKSQREGIIIGNDVWIGMNVIILPGVTIGNGVTIAAGSVVTQDLPHYVVAAGVPAKIIKNKHSEEIVEILNQISWWNWGSKLVKERMADFYILDIPAFIEKYSVQA